MLAPPEPIRGPLQAHADMRGQIGLIAGPMLALLVYFLTSTLPPDERRLGAILSLVIVFWISEAIPIPVTALLGPALCVMAGIGTAREVFSSFASPIIFVFLGGFLLARGMMVNRIDRRIALAFLESSWVGRSPGRIRLAVGLVAALLSMWISNTATAAMLFPVVVGISSALEGVHRGDSKVNKTDVARTESYSTGLMLMTAYACSIGGLATPIGTPPNLVGLEMMETLAGRQISFFEWMRIGLPISVCLFAVLAGVIGYLYPAPIGPLAGLKGALKNLRNEIGSWGRAQTVTLVAFGVAVVLWVTPGLFAVVYGKTDPAYQFLTARLSEGVVAVFAASLLFLIPTQLRPLRGAVTWREAVDIDWGTILLFGGGLSLGGLMHSTGLAERVARGVLGMGGTGGVVDSSGTVTSINVWILVAAVALIATVLTEVASNTASAGMLVPVTIAVAVAAGVSPIPPAIAATIGCSLAFMLPVSTPPNAILYGSGRIRIGQMVRAGLWMDVLGFVVLLALLAVLLPWFGLN